MTMIKQEDRARPVWPRGSIVAVRGLVADLFYGVLEARLARAEFHRCARAGRGCALAYPDGRSLVGWTPRRALRSNRGLAYLRTGKGVEAATEFQKIIDHKGANWGPRYPLAFVGLARAVVQAGDTARAKKAYQDFLTLWKDADPDIPVLIEAKKEHAMLN